MFKNKFALQSESAHTCTCAFSEATKLCKVDMRLALLSRDLEGRYINID